MADTLINNLLACVATLRHCPPSPDQVSAMTGLRTSGIGRAFYCFLVNRRIVVLHAFVKKSQQTPDRELKLARKRLKEILNG